VRILIVYIRLRKRRRGLFLIKGKAKDFPRSGDGEGLSGKEASLRGRAEPFL